MGTAQDCKRRNLISTILTELRTHCEKQAPCRTARGDGQIIPAHGQAGHGRRHAHTTAGRPLSSGVRAPFPCRWLQQSERWRLRRRPPYCHSDPDPLEAGHLWWHVDNYARFRHNAREAVGRARPGNEVLAEDQHLAAGPRSEPHLRRHSREPRTSRHGEAPRGTTAMATDARRAGRVCRETRCSYDPVPLWPSRVPVRVATLTPAKPWLPPLATRVGTLHDRHVRDRATRASSGAGVSHTCKHHCCSTPPDIARPRRGLGKQAMGTHHLEPSVAPKQHAIPAHSPDSITSVATPYT